MIWNHFIGAETITYLKINWWNTSPNISISGISRRFPHSSITFGLMNYFNWFIHYHVIALEERRTSYQVIRYDYYTTCLVSYSVAKVRCSWLNAGSFVKAGTNIFGKEICEWMLVCSKEEKFMWREEEDILATSWGMSWRRWEQWLNCLSSSSSNRITAMVKQAKTAEIARNYDGHTRCE